MYNLKPNKGQIAPKKMIIDKMFQRKGGNAVL